MVFIAGAIVQKSSPYKCVTRKSNLYCHNGSKVVDGIYAPVGVNELTSVAHTGYEKNPWLQIDLEKSFCISAVKIWNRNMDGSGKKNFKEWLFFNNNSCK